MCKNNQSDFKSYEKKYRLADFFNMHWDEYIKKPSEYIKPEQLKAVNAILSCRTAVLGVEVYVCEDCGQTTEIYHSCKNRFCPTCSWKDTVDWAKRVQYQMLNIKHRHIVCTLPHSLNPIIKNNSKKLLSLLMRVSAETFKDWFSAKHKLKIGVIEVLHTFGEKKEFHPHTHMIVSWGGIHKTTGKLKEIKSEYVSYKFLQKKFRAKFEDELIRMNDDEELYHDFPDRRSFMQFVKKVNKTDWVIHLEPAMKTPEKVIRYIGRYSKRACLSEYKITEIDGEYITFKYKDNKDRDEDNKAKVKLLKLHYSDFFPRLLQHVPIPYFRLVRYYGLYSNHGRIPKAYKNNKVEENDLAEVEQYNPTHCEDCGREKIHVYTYFIRRKMYKPEQKEWIDFVNEYVKKRFKKAA